MRWYYKVQGGHTHVRVFMNGGKCGDLVFRNEEFNWFKLVVENIQSLSVVFMEFIPETESE